MGDQFGTYTHLLPEIVVAVTGVVILVADVLWPGRATEPARSKPAAAYLGVAGLLLAGVATVVLAGTERTLFAGVVQVDGLSTFFRLLFIGIGVLVLLLSVDSVPTFSKWSAEYYLLVVWCTLGHMVLASSAELFTIFVALQLSSIPLIVLIGYAKRDPRSGEASLKYLLLVLVSTAVLLYGMTLIYGALGTSTLVGIGAELAAEGNAIQPVVALGIVLLLTGFAFKVTAAPFHFWVPDAYDGAPAPVTAFLSVGSKFAGFALALRIIVTGVHVPLDWAMIFGAMAALSMTWGNLGALMQTNMKRMLAYSGIAQAGYLLVGLAPMTKEGVGAVLFYAVAYTAANLAAFSVVVICSRAIGSDRIEDYAGLSRRAPLLALSLAVALLSLGGLPLLAGFMAKFYIFLYAARAGLAWLVAVGVINSVISLYYYLRVVWVMYVREPAGETRVPVGARTAVAMSIALAATVALGVLPEWALRATDQAAAALFR